MSNLLYETREAIEQSKHHPRDIIFIGSKCSGHRCTWQEFIGLANQQYDSGYGSQEVALDLIIVFKDSSYLEREEYDGSEWWRLIEPFTMPLSNHIIRHLFKKGFMEDTLETINDKELEE